MTHLHLTAAFASPHYADVHAHTDWLFDVAVIAGLVGAAAFMVAFISALTAPDTKKWRNFTYTAAGMFVLSAMVSLIVCMSHEDSRPNAFSNMSDNIKQKYGVTLDKDSAVPASDKLTQPNPYQLDLPDGTKGTYSIKWDEATSEPTIINTPTLQPLSQTIK